MSACDKFGCKGRTNFPSYQCKKVTIFIIIIINIYFSFVKTYSVNSCALEMTFAEHVACKFLVLKISMSTNPRRGAPIYYLAHVPITPPLARTHTHTPWIRHYIFFPSNYVKSVADPGFPRGGVPTPGGGQHMILPNFPKNCMKLKEFGSPGRGGHASLAPPPHPLRSSTGS